MKETQPLLAKVKTKATKMEKRNIKGTTLDLNGCGFKTTRGKSIKIPGKRT